MSSDRFTVSVARLLQFSRTDGEVTHRWGAEVYEKGKRKSLILMVGNSPAEALRAAAVWFDEGQPTIEEIEAKQGATP